MNDLINFEKYYDVFRDISRIVHASVEFERLNNATGPTGGEILMKKGKRGV